MISFTLIDCKNCNEIEDLLKQIDCKIAEYTDVIYKARVYMSVRKFKRRELKDLLFYKEILKHLMWNKHFYDTPYKNIISKVKTLI